MSNFYSLAKLGWQPFFQNQITLDEWDRLLPQRVIEQHKSEITLAGDLGVFSHPITAAMPSLVVGDWVLVDQARLFVRLLERKTCFTRKSAGQKASQQLISANVDTAFIVCSMNEDFNPNRIERFLSLVNESQAEAVILLSKSDLSQAPEAFIYQAQKIDNLLQVVALNCLDSQSVLQLQPWIKQGRTIAVIGSSGVGKSTLVNTLLGEEKQSTGAVRADDHKGRHTTSRRTLSLMHSGALLLDTPGMREIQLANCKDGILTTFSDIEELAQSCRFHDCLHQSEPGCAVQQAIQQGLLEQRRLNNYLKLSREDKFNSATLAEKRTQDKALGKFYKRTLQDSHKFKGR